MTAVKLLTTAKSATAFITLCLSLISTFANAQNTAKMKKEILTELNNQQMISRLTCFKVKKQYHAELKKTISAYVKQSLTDEGNIMSEAYYEQQDSTVLWLIERWINREALKRFSNSSQAITLSSLTKKVLVKPATTTYVNDLEPLSKQQWRRASKEKDDQLTIMLFVDAKPGSQDNFKSIYSKALPEFRNEPGVVTYQLSQVETDSTQFVTYEKFRSKEAFQYHLDFPPILPVIDYLNTSIKKPPFQQGLHTLIEFAPLTRE